MNRLDSDKRAQVVAALVEGNSIRSIVRMTGVAKRSARIVRDLDGVFLLAVAVVAPFGHVPVHVIQPPAVGRFLADGMGRLTGVGLQPGIGGKLGGIVAE